MLKYKPDLEEAVARIKESPRYQAACEWLRDWKISYEEVQAEAEMEKGDTSFNLADLNEMKYSQLQEVARECNINAGGKRDELLERIAQKLGLLDTDDEEDIEEVDEVEDDDSDE